MSSTVDKLTSLPADIFTVVTEDFDLADLCNLRLTSQNLHAIATNPTFQARFHHVRTDLSFDNLKSLIAICSNPDLGHLVKEVTVLAKHYDDQELKQQVKDGTRWVAEKGNGPIFASHGERMSDSEKAEAQAMVDEIANLRDKQAAMQADGSDVKLLAEAFDSLGDRQVVLNIEAAVQNRLDAARQPIARARDREGNRQRMAHVFKVTIAALANSSLQITTLNVFNMAWGGFVGLDKLHEAIASDVSSGNAPSFPIPASLRNIQALTLNLNPAPKKEIGKEQLDPYDTDKYSVYAPAVSDSLNDAYLASLTALLSQSAHSLTHLDIRFRGWHALKLDCATIFSKLAAENLSFPLLKRLQLRNVIVHAEDLVTILRKSPTVTHLGLHEVSTPHNPAHEHIHVEYPNSEPEWSQTEPDAPGWKDAWMPLFDAFTAPAPDMLCPRLETLEMMGLSLTSFDHRIYFTAPKKGLVEYVKSIMGNEEKKKKEWYKIQAFQEGLHCCILNGIEVHGIERDDNVANSQENDDEIYKCNLGNGLSVPIPRDEEAETEQKNKPKGVTYKIATTRPYGSAAYYNWLHYYSTKEFAEKGCMPDD